ncbi:MAG: hypothetical protein Kow0042_11060 [Calditrichia bacterium]
MSDVEIHLLLHYPVNQLIRTYSENLVDVYWGYHQKKLLLNPWRFFQLWRNLRRGKYDLVINSHTPDHFSLSHALLGRLCNPRMLLGFNVGDASYYNDISLPPSTDKHYADAQVDLWRYFDPRARLQWGGLRISPEQVRDYFRKWKLELEPPAVMLWLGATGNKMLPADLVAFLYEQISKQTNLRTVVALGPGDVDLLSQYPPWLQEKVFIWDRPLVDTAVFLSGFKLFISADTGPMHLAVALGIPTLTIFTHSNLQQYGYHDGIQHFSLQYRSGGEFREKLIECLKTWQEKNVL